MSGNKLAFICVEDNCSDSIDLLYSPDPHIKDYTVSTNYVVRVTTLLGYNNQRPCDVWHVWHASRRALDLILLI